MMGKFPEVLKVQPVLSQAQPVHLQLTASSPQTYHSDRGNSLQSDIRFSACKTKQDRNKTNGNKKRIRTICNIPKAFYFILFFKFLPPGLETEGHYVKGKMKPKPSLLESRDL